MNFEKLMFVSPAPHRIKCKCGWYNNPPSKKNKDKARCKKCGLLIDKQELFKSRIKKLRRENQL